MEQLSIIIVNYRTPQLVIDCIRSIDQQNAISPYEIIVVDNDSKDASEAIILGEFPGLKFIQMGYNSGFARANNEGIRRSQAPIVLLLNSDTIEKDGAIYNCYQQFIASHYVACGVQLLNTDGSPQISGNFAMKGGLNYLLPLPFIGNLLKTLATVIKIKKPNIPNATDTVEVDWINGAYLMVKKKAIDTAGLLDEDFFLYAEEAEWCNRLKKAGELCIFGNCNVVHLQGESSNETFASTGKGYSNLFDQKGLQIMLSNFVRIRKQFGIGWFLFDLFFYIITIPVFLLCLPFDNKYTYKQWQAYTKNIVGLIKYTRKIISGKPYFYKVL
ncbi:MAG TPA: glycosyltransferase family 2 protein [Ferruginibacter sp.]|jgi:GT2 family glycosyltransferase|nr:glycosyltransferase family 2 protein [Ferruginibacter sp.]